MWLGPVSRTVSTSAAPSRTACTSYPKGASNAQISALESPAGS
jgi:hypothetical protein